MAEADFLALVIVIVERGEIERETLGRLAEGEVVQVARA